MLMEVSFLVYEFLLSGNAVTSLVLISLTVLLTVPHEDPIKAFTKDTNY